MEIFGQSSIWMYPSCKCAHSQSSPAPQFGISLSEVHTYLGLNHIAIILFQLLSRPFVIVIGFKQLYITLESFFFLDSGKLCDNNSLMYHQLSDSHKVFASIVGIRVHKKISKIFYPCFC